MHETETLPLVKLTHIEINSLLLLLRKLNCSSWWERQVEIVLELPQRQIIMSSRGFTTRKSVKSSFDVNYKHAQEAKWRLLMVRALPWEKGLHLIPPICFLRRPFSLTRWKWIEIEFPLGAHCIGDNHLCRSRGAWIFHQRKTEYRIDAESICLFFIESGMFDWICVYSWTDCERWNKWCEKRHWFGALRARGSFIYYK